MEDDDDFGDDLYTDVLQSFPSSSLPPPPPDSLHSHRRGLDLNLQLNDPDEEEFGAGVSNPGASQTLAPHGSSAKLELNSSSVNSGLEVGESRDFGNTDGGSGANFDEEGFRFDVEEEEVHDANGDDVGLGPVIPGLSAGRGVGVGGGHVFDELGRGEGGEDDWESDDSEDDLQIVLNETSHDPMAMEMGGELVDGQNDGLGIGADGHGMGFQHTGMEDQEWGEDGVEAADGEKKEGGEMTKVNQGISVAPKPGFAGHGYHTFHSQFKVRAPKLCYGGIQKFCIVNRHGSVIRSF